jgi:hypothetical protein
MPGSTSIKDQIAPHPLLGLGSEQDRNASESEDIADPSTPSYRARGNGPEKNKSCIPQPQRRSRDQHNLNRITAFMSDTGPQTEQLPPGLLEALRQPSKDKLVPRPLTSFPDGILSVTEQGTDAQANKFDILCPRNGCGSIILKRGVGTCVERPSVQVHPFTSCAYFG